MTKNTSLRIKVAVVGPDDRVEKAMDLADEFPTLELQPWLYESEEEALDLFHRALPCAEVIVTMGPIPYYIIKASVVPTIPLLYVPLNGSGLMRTLFEIFVQDRLCPGRVSIDTLSKKVAQETFNELQIQRVSIISWENEGRISCQELVDFHYKLWQNGKIDLALTCLRSAFNRLKELGLPVYRVVATNSAIRSALIHAAVRGEELRSKDHHIAVQICDIDKFSSIIKQAHSEYVGVRIRLVLQNLLNDYAERSWASVHFVEGDRFFVYTTRGMLEKTTNYYQVDPFLEEVRRQLPVTISIGTGLGETAYHAERNAHKALERAKAHGGDCSFIVMEDGRMIGPLGKDERLERSLLSHDPEFLEMADRARLGIETLAKIASLPRFLGKETFTADELAHGLRISSRSARRVLNRLMQAGMAEICGREHAETKGRPRSVFRINMKKEV